MTAAQYEPLNESRCPDSVYGALVQQKTSPFSLSCFENKDRESFCILCTVSTETATVSTEVDPGGKQMKKHRS